MSCPQYYLLRSGGSTVLRVLQTSSVLFQNNLELLTTNEQPWENEAVDALYIKDPEHPYSLEDLKVLTEDSIEVDDEQSYIRVTFTPTVEHCSMATLIGLCLRVKLMRCLPSRYKVDIRVAPGTHATEASAVTQLGFSHLNLVKPAFVHSYLLCFSNSSRMST
ncbi:MIP18 family protein [Capsicum baccatum]|uniref:MIP18 family protein n=1 Tax=Capsicum baccatum TaxID=33114 RepID=A0A2G2WN71_CAPBA|nr:MIP18 family protein [Capsicum baccatum]